ncbi:MAG TPA: AAA family ATPase, partial [Chloroflexia bacterium]|nr:AAA family ATPase [Chloroflexia bacterium]
MAASPYKSVISPVLVGRAVQLGAIEQSLGHSILGRGQTVLISGEAGIGKSRLVAEAIVRASQQGVTVLQGNCFETDGVLPYAPICDLLRSTIGALPADRQASILASIGPELSKVLPEITLWQPDIRPTPMLAPEHEKRRLLEAFNLFFSRLAASDPLLVVIEDLHWGDDLSLECLLELSRRVISQRITLVLTYRSDEVHPSLRYLLSQLDRERRVVDLGLGPLSMGEVDEMVRAIFDMQRPVRAEFLETIYPLTEGNPYFIEETLKSLIASGDIFYADGEWDRKPMQEIHVPRSIQDAVQRRVAHLDMATRELLALAAVMRHRFGFPLLQSLFERSEDVLAQQMRELDTAQLVVEVSAEQFAFRHALTRRAIYAQFLGRERRFLHRAVGEAIEQTYTSTLDMYSPDLAHHFYEAGVWDKALLYSQKAGENALSLYALRVACEHFTRALECVGKLGVLPSTSSTSPTSPTSPASLASLYRMRAGCYATLGEFDLALADHEAALRAVQGGEDSRAEGQTLLDLANLWKARDYTRAMGYINRALELARRTGDAPSLARSLNHVGNWYVLLDRPHDAIRCHREALEIYTKAENRLGIAESLFWLGAATYSSGDLVQSEDCYRRGMGIFQALDERTRLVNGYAALAIRGATHLTDTMVFAAPGYPGPDRDGEIAVSLAHNIGSAPGEAFSRAMLSFCLGGQGKFTEALDCALEGLRIAEEIEHRPWMYMTLHALGAVCLDMVALSQARAYLERAHMLARDLGSLYWTRSAAASLALTYIAQGDLSQVEPLLNAISGTDSPASTGIADPAPTAAQRLCLYARAELALASSDPEGALRLADRMIEWAAIRPGSGAIPRLWKLRGEALAALRRPEEAEATLQ